jgi:hypothetical protein
MRSLRVLAVWAGAAAFFAGAVALVGSGGIRDRHTFAPGSVFNESKAGLSLAFRYLAKRSSRAEGRGAPVSVLAKRVGPESLSPNAVLFRLRPQRPGISESAEKSSRLLTRAEEAWVRAGGRLVLGLVDDYGPARLSAARHTGPIKKVFPVWPGVRTIVPAGDLHAISGPAADEAVSLFARGSEPVVSRISDGRGEVLLLAAPEVLENESLGKGDHLGLLEAVAETGRPIIFDEWVHGLDMEEGLLEQLLEWGLGPTLVCVALSLALVLWRGRTRLGPEEEDAPEARSEAVDLVDSMAQLYDRALSRRDAAHLHLEGLRRAVSLRTGLTGADLAKRLEVLLGGFTPRAGGEGELAPSEFLRSLGAVNEGYRRLYEHAHPRRRP